MVMRTPAFFTTKVSTSGVLFSEGNPTIEMLNQILSRVSATPTKTQLLKLLKDIENDYLDGVNIVFRALIENMKDLCVMVDTVPKHIRNK